MSNKTKDIFTLECQICVNYFFLQMMNKKKKKRKRLLTHSADGKMYLTIYIEMTCFKQGFA